MQPDRVAQAAETSDRAAQQIRYWMSAPAIVIAAGATVGEALALMHEHSIRRLPVVTPDGELCGIITDGDIRAPTFCTRPGSTSALSPPRSVVRPCTR